jgi:hypothetical protein
VAGEVPLNIRITKGWLRWRVHRCIPPVTEYFWRGGTAARRAMELAADSGDHHILIWSDGDAFVATRPGAQPTLRWTSTGAPPWQGHMSECKEGT